MNISLHNYCKSFLNKSKIVYFLLFFFFLSIESIQGQCTSCTSTLNTFVISSNFIFTAGQKTCFTGTSNISNDITCGNNAS